MFYRFIAIFNPANKYHQLFYYNMGNRLNLEVVNDGIVFDASFSTPASRAERLLTKEPDTLHWINEKMVPGDIFYDIGANIGIYSLYAASRNIKVYAFEPESSSYAILNNNIKINSFDESIKALNIALNNTNLISDLNISSFKPGKSGHSFEDPIKYGENYAPEFQQACLGYRLDSLIEFFSLPLQPLIQSAYR